MAGPISRRSTNASRSFRRSRIAVAILIGILLGCICAVLYPRGLFSLIYTYSDSQFQSPRLSKSNLQIGSTSCESTERVNMLKSDIEDLSNINEELKKQIKDLNEKLQAVEEKNSQAGPFGTVKGIRTKPTVLPDETVSPRLAKIMEKIAVKNELIVSLANSSVKPMLEVWASSIKRLGISNYLIVALDDGIVDFCKENNVPFYIRDPDEDIDSVGKTGGSHKVLGLKFRILREFLQLGCSVLLSDVDIVYIQNPFDHIYRDSDVEAMSDGYNNMTAYGYNDVFDDPAMGWARYAHTMRIWVYNSGFLYLRPTLATIEVLDRVADRLSHASSEWDQVVFNEELFCPSHPGYIGLHASKRTMDHYLFMNSKVLFKEVRKNDDLKKLTPVIVHVNYHLDKLLRMKAVFEFYINGKQDAFDLFSDVSD